jgi:hypothetical protein
MSHDHDQGHGPGQDQGRDPGDHEHHHGHGHRQILLPGRELPRWIVVPIGIALAGLAVALGMILEPAGYALSPESQVPTPTIPAATYARDLSGGCHDCHFSVEALVDSAADPHGSEAYWIDPDSVRTKHGSLGCVACHSGNGQASDKTLAHTDLVLDVTRTHPEQCIICHYDLPTKIPRDELLIPHDLVEYKIRHGEEALLFCSDCHGRVGHGFDPVSGETSCSMTGCIDCHSTQWDCESCHQGPSPGSQMSGCEVCHEGPHDVSDRMTCPCCHTSLVTWAEIDASSHPMELAGTHGDVHCFVCHTYPDFRGLTYACVHCHESGHTEWGSDDCTQCHDPGATWEVVSATWDKHVEFWPMYKGDHLLVQCRGCHFETYTGLDPSCSTCHSLPESHEPNYTKCWLCH